jgi:hypothetical protein
MTSYQLTGENWIFRVDDQSRIAPGAPGYQQYLDEVAAGTAIVLPSDPLTVEQAVEIVQEWLNAQAQTRGYDGILSACTYATSTVPRFQAEATAAVIGRDNAWADCYSIMTGVQAGERLAPANKEALLAELTPIVWPE